MPAVPDTGHSCADYTLPLQCWWQALSFSGACLVLLLCHLEKSTCIEGAVSQFMPQINFCSRTRKPPVISFTISFPQTSWNFFNHGPQTREERCRGKHRAAFLSFSIPISCWNAALVFPLHSLSPPLVSASFRSLLFVCPLVYLRYTSPLPPRQGGNLTTDALYI